MIAVIENIKRNVGKIIRLTFATGVFNLKSI